MRKIEEQMIWAIKSGMAFRSGSTVVHHAGSIAEVYLYGSLIARKDSADALAPGWTFNLCGFNTATTRSRLNALAQSFRLAPVGTARGTPYMRKDAQRVEVPESGWFTP